MARLARLNLADIPQHVIQRGNNRQPTFFAEDDYWVYLDKLREYSQKYQVAIHAFILMTNHTHLLLTPSTDQGVSQLMQSLGRYFGRYINQTYQRSGTLWEGRYKSTLVDEAAYFLTVSRYIELNPVRAKMVKHPKDYPWSSFQGNALGKDIELLTPHPCYQGLGQSEEQRRAAYQALFKQHISLDELAAIRRNTNKGWILGNDRFKDKIAAMTDRRVTPSPRGGDRKSKAYRENMTKSNINLL